MLVGIEPFNRFAPSNSALSVTCPSCRRIDLKSESSAVRAAVSSEVSIAATTFSFNCTSRSETDSPAVIETSATEFARSRLILTAPRAPMSARCP
jgi:hypothetical protein